MSAATKTPILDTLRNVPEDARQIYEHDCMHSQNIPFGRIAAEAADTIEAQAARIKALELDKARLDWLESDPRLAELTTNGTTVDCYYYAVAGAPGLKLREIMDAAMARAPKVFSDPFNLTRNT